MPEIKRDLIKLVEGEPYSPGVNECVITESHSIADIIRYAISCSDHADIKYIVDGMGKD